MQERKEEQIVWEENFLFTDLPDLPPLSVARGFMEKGSDALPLNTKAPRMIVFARSSYWCASLERGIELPSRQALVFQQVIHGTPGLVHFCRVLWFM
jgi:hypothetical protein